MLTEADALIVADDLMGAAETAAAFASRGMKTVVSWTGDAPTCEVLVIDTQTRRKSPQEAVFAVGSVVAGFAGLLYKNIDATLRGNVGAEIAAALRASKRDAVILVPAYPSLGYRTVGGKQIVEDKPLPVDLVAMLLAEGLRVSAVSLAEVRSGKVVRGRADVYLFDAETDEDLERIAEATSGLNVVYAGSGGFARHLPLLSEREAVPLKAVKCKKPILTVIGSTSAAAQEQAMHVPTGALPLALTAAALREGDGGRSWRMLAMAYARAVQLGDVWLALLSTAGEANDSVQLAEFSAAQAAHIGGLIVTGSETARALLCALGVHSIEVLGELESGAPMSRTDTGLPLVMKAGSFGDIEMLARLRNAFK